MSASRAVNAMILILMATATIYEAVHVLRLRWRHAATLDLATALEQGLPPEAQYLARFQASHRLDQPAGECDDAVSRSILTINLAALSAALAAKDETAVRRTARTVLDSARVRLICSPVDGNAWLRYATSLAHLSGPVPASVDALELSYSTAPDEGWVIEARLPFSAYLYQAGVTSIEPKFVRDLRLFVDYQPTERVARTYVEETPKMQKLLHPLIAAEPEARKTEILAQIDQLGVIFDPK